MTSGYLLTAMLYTDTKDELMAILYKGIFAKLKRSQNNDVQPRLLYD